MRPEDPQSLRLVILVDVATLLREPLADNQQIAGLIGVGPDLWNAH